MITYSRRVHRLLLVCAGLALTACSGQIEMADAALSADSSAAPYGAERQTLAANDATEQLPTSGVPATSMTSTASKTGTGSRTSSPRQADTAPASSTKQPTASASNDTQVTSQPSTAPVAAEPVEPQPVAPQPVAPQPVQPVVPAPSLATILWNDDIQTSGQSPWGFNQVQLERPIGQSVGGSSEVNLMRVPNPIGEGYAIKHVATFDNNGGSRSQAGIYSFANDAFEAQVKRPEGVWIAQEWYFPQPLSAGDRLDTQPWVNLWDFHSVGAGDRWDTQPGLMLAEDGSMRVKWTWRKENAETAWSIIDLPVGEWFDVEMHYVWSSSGATVSFWINGELALQQHGVKTKSSSHNSVETYMKFYGSANSGPSWNPQPAVKYTRNVRIAGERIWR